MMAEGDIGVSHTTIALARIASDEPCSVVLNSGA